MRGKAWAPAGVAVLLVALNVAICRELFGIEYTRHMGSIEAAYIGLSRYIVQNWPDLGWFPLWYGGIPFPNTYPPLLHLLVAAFAAATGASPALAHHAVTAFFYCLGAAALYWLARSIGMGGKAALLAALFYSLASPSAWLIPAVAVDMGSPWSARRLHALVHYGDGPHITSLTLLAAAVALFVAALEKRRWEWDFATAIAVASVALTNWLGTAALAGATLCWLLASDARLRAWTRAAGLAAFAYALAAPWIPPSTVSLIFHNAQWVHGDYRMGLRHVVYWAVFLLALVLLNRTLRGRSVSAAVRFAILYLVLAGGVTLAYAWFRMTLLPQPVRYHLEMEMAIALLFGAGAARLLEIGARRVVVAAIALLLAACAWQYRNCRRFAQGLIQPLEIRQTIEYRMARWLDQHLGERRVMAPGSASFWLNAFADTPQLGGGFDQGVTNQLLPAIIFQIYSGMNAGPREGEIALLWLKAFGVHAVGLGGPASREYYKPFRNPNKFSGLLEELWREGDDVIYAVPQRTTSLARVVKREHLVQQPPVTVVHVDPLRPFVAALDDPSLPETRWRWRSRREAEIVGELRREHVLSIAISYHPGWRARVNGTARAVSSDGLGLMVIEPECNGPCRIELTYTGGWESTAVRSLSWGAACAGLAGLAMGWWRRTWRSCAARGVPRSDNTPPQS